MPVFQLRLDLQKTTPQHFALTQLLLRLHERGVLIEGSGNVVHNLPLSIPRLMASDDEPYDWATEVDEFVKA